MENLIAIANVSEGTFTQRPLTDEEMAADLENQKINQKIQLAKENEKAQAQAKRQVLLEKLGITEDEAKLLLS